MKNLFLVRGLPGSGKTTLARRLAGEYVFEADQFFETADGYVFEPDRLVDAHQECQRRARAAMKEGYPNVAVSNTFTRRWEMDVYIEVARLHDYHVVVCHSGPTLGDEELEGRCVHRVPASAITAMRERSEP